MIIYFFLPVSYVYLFISCFGIIIIPSSSFNFPTLSLLSFHFFLFFFLSLSLFLSLTVFLFLTLCLTMTFFHPLILVSLSSLHSFFSTFIDFLSIRTFTLEWDC